MRLKAVLSDVTSTLAVDRSHPSFNLTSFPIQFLPNLSFLSPGALSSKRPPPQLASSSLGSPSPPSLTAGPPPPPPPGPRRRLPACAPPLALVPPACPPHGAPALPALPEPCPGSPAAPPRPPPQLASSSLGSPRRRLRLLARLLAAIKKVEFDDTAHGEGGV